MNWEDEDGMGTTLLLVPKRMHEQLCDYVERCGPGITWERDLRMLNPETGLLWLAQHNMAISGLELLQNPGWGKQLDKMVEDGRIVKAYQTNADATVLSLG